MKMFLFSWLLLTKWSRDFKLLSCRFLRTKMCHLIFRHYPRRYLSIYQCVKIVPFRSCSGPYFPAFVLNTDQNNCEYGHFSRCVLCWIIFLIVNVVPTLSFILEETALYWGSDAEYSYHQSAAGSRKYAHPLLNDFVGYLVPLLHIVFFLACTNIYTIEALSIHCYVLVKKSPQSSKWARTSVQWLSKPCAWLVPNLLAPPYMTKFIPITD